MDLSKLTVKQLKTVAREEKIKGRSTLKKKSDLLEAVSLSLKNKTKKNHTNTKNNDTHTKEETLTNINTCEVVSTKLKKEKNYNIKKEDIILLFFSKCSGRENNDVYNDMREYILANILTNKFESHFNDPEYSSKWNLIKTSWKECLDILFTSTSKKEYNSINVIKKGGRKNNYDFDIEYLKDKKVVHSVHNIEFKHGGKSISEIPQFFNAIANKSFLPGYADWFYDNYVIKEEPWTRFKDITPSKSDYLKEIYKNKSPHKFFIKLKDEEKDKEYYKLKQVKTAESIKKWLHENYKKLDLKDLSKEFIRTQNGKIFILWDKDSFHIDTFDEDDLNITKIISIKNNNAILINSESNKIQYAMLLRWKNQLGVLLPAWQISMKRLD
jgi:hypothetical protein